MRFRSSSTSTSCSDGTRWTFPASRTRKKRSAASPRRAPHFRNRRLSSPASQSCGANREEWTEALDAYDATLALVPTHRDALLGRAVTLSHLARHGEAVAAATRILELGSWFTGEAYYWRAWNEYHLARIEEARIDTDKAKGLMHNASVLVLSGMIEWHERRLDESEAELQDALTLDAGQCEAAFLLGPCVPNAGSGHPAPPHSSWRSAATT
jgi:hypothetical protein